MMTWQAWRCTVYELLRYNCGWSQVALDSMDWDAWRVSYNEGLTPEEAVHEEVT